MQSSGLNSAYCLPYGLGSASEKLGYSGCPTDCHADERAAKSVHGNTVNGVGS